MSTRGKLENTVLAPVDLRDQPHLSLIFLIDTAAGGRQAFFVDYIDVKDGVVYGKRYTSSTGTAHTVIAVPVAGAWTVLRTDLVILRTLEESIRKQKTDFDVQQKLVDELGTPVAQPLVLSPPPQDIPTTPLDGPYL